MRGGAWPPLVFATVLLAMGGMNRIWESSTIMSATFAFAAAMMYVWVGVMVARHGREPVRRGAPEARERLRAIPAASLGATLLGLGAGAVAVGFIFGASFLIGGALVMAAAAGLLTRELTAQRHALERERAR